MKPLYKLVTPLVLAPSLAAADDINVMADIAPVHGLVQQVLGDLGQARLLLEGQFDVHDYALKPSQASALQKAEVVFWIGEELSPWLEGPLDALASDATTIALIDQPGVEVLDFRDFDDDEHAEGDDHDDHDDHDHEEHAEKDEHDDHDHEEHAEKDEHDEHEGHGHHDHGGVDAHAWLSPENAIAWLDVIADTLSDKYPDHRAEFHDNASAAAAEISAMDMAIKAEFAELPEFEFIVIHDALQYFEHSYGLEVAGAVSEGDSHAHSPQNVLRLQAVLDSSDVNCAVIDQGEAKNTISRLFPNTSINVVEIAVFGNGTNNQPLNYAQYIKTIADSFVQCAK